MYAVGVIGEVAGRMAAPGSKSHPGDWVTDTDRGLEQHTRSVLADAFPDIPVLGEEFSAASEATRLPGTEGGPELLWIVDPVDGTANYVAGLPWCCYSLGLVDRSGPLLGVIGDPYRREVHVGVRGGGVTTLRLDHGTRIAPPPPPTSLAGRLLAVEPSPDGTRPNLSVLMPRLRAAHMGLRILGSSALAIAEVALGKVAAALLPAVGYAAWDVAGALALATEAGMTVIDLGGTGGPIPLHGLLVSAPAVADDVAELLSGS